MARRISGNWHALVDAATIVIGTPPCSWASSRHFFATHLANALSPKLRYAPSSYGWNSKVIEHLSGLIRT